MRYYLNVPVPDPLFQTVRAFEEKWQGTSRSDPHVTIVTPKEVSEKTLEESLVGNIHTVLEAIGQFPVTVAGLGYFGNKDHIFAKVVRTPELVTCHGALMSVFDDIAIPRQDQFANIPTPHITLASHLSPTDGEKAWDDINHTIWDATFLCTTIQLLRITTEEARWIAVAAFHLR